MRIKVCLLLLCSLLIFSCEKLNNETIYQSTGTITGKDIRRCPFPMCGGYIIQIDSNQYRFGKTELPGNFTYDDNQLPLKVELDWELDTGIYVGSDWIKVLKIRYKK